MDFARRSYQKELLDAPDIPFPDIKRNMQELEFINRWLGGHAITIRGAQKLTAQKAGKPLVICEIGCGGGDNLKSLHKYFIKKKIPVTFIGIDINRECIDFATVNCSALPHIRFISSDYSLVNFDEKPDIIFSSLFSHHLDDGQFVSMLQWCAKNARAGFFINDLQRHRLAYYSIKWLTALFSKSYLVKNDAPLSVLRGFSRKELETLIIAAGIGHCTIQWKWAFRWLVTYHPN